jgi:acyl-CoA synthetase (AMP-forming)/AMP-acid ligase II
LISNIAKSTIFQRIWSSASNAPTKKIIYDQDRDWTWSELLWRAQAYADALECVPVTSIHTPIVPILVNRKGETVAAILGALIAGRGFAPMSVQQPITRIAYCLNALGAMSIVNPEGVEYWNGAEAEKPHQVSVRENMDVKGLPLQPIEASQEKVLYVLFTSGSTGEPKGVMASYGNIENTMLWSQDMLTWSQSDVIGCCTNFFFDISMFDVFSSLYFNIPIAIYSQPAELEKVVSETAQFKITSVFGVPTFFSQILRMGMLGDSRLSSLRRIVSGGDFFPPAHIVGWLEARPDIDIFNVWGPTETSIVNTMHRVTTKDLPALRLGRSAPVGKMHERMSFCLIDGDGSVLRLPNQRGEICMLGECVTQGYLGDTERTTYAYIEIDGMRAFRTQDLGYVDEAGNLFIVGRMGSTVKVAGYRIDFGEVESAAVALTDVHLACSVVYEGRPDYGYRELWLAVEPKNSEAKLDIYSIKKKLRAVLPLYMVPKRIFVFSNLPRNPNGKIDRKAVLKLALTQIEL